MTDGFFSRPGLGRVALGTIAPDIERIDACLRRAGVDRLEAVLPVHSHFDHVMDSAVVAARTGATLVGGTSTANVGRGLGLADIVVATPGEPMTYGAWTVTLVESEHCPPDRYPGTIDEPVVPPVRTKAYRCGEAWSILLEHGRPGGPRWCRAAPVSSAARWRAGRPRWPTSASASSASRTRTTCGPTGTRPCAPSAPAGWCSPTGTTSSAPWTSRCASLPFAGDDLDVTMRVLGALAAEDGVPLHLPQVWRREDPWA